MRSIFISWVPVPQFLITYFYDGLPMRPMWALTSTLLSPYVTFKTCNSHCLLISVENISVEKSCKTFLISSSVIGAGGSALLSAALRRCSTTFSTSSACCHLSGRSAKRVSGSSKHASLRTKTSGCFMVDKFNCSGDGRRP